MITKKSFFTEFSSNYFWNTVQVFSKQGFLVYLILISLIFLSKEEFGYLGYSLAFSSFLVLSIDFGISQSVNRFVAKYKITHQDKLQTLLFPIFIYTIGIALVVSLITFFILDSFFSIPITYLYYLIPINFFLPLTSIFDGFYRGLKEFKFLGIIYLGITFLLIPISLFLVSTLQLEGALLSYLLLYISYFLFILIFSSSYLKPNFFFKESLPILKYGILIGFMLLSYLLYIKADILLLGRYNYIDMIANYQIIQKLLEVIIIPFAIFSSVLTPTIIEYYEKNNLGNIKKKFRSLIGIIFTISFIAMIFVFVSFPIALQVFLPSYYTPEMIEIFKLSLFLIPLFIIKQTLFGTFIVSTGRILSIVFPSLFFGLLNVLLSFMFIQISPNYVILTTVACLTLSLCTTLLLFSRFFRNKNNG